MSKNDDIHKMFSAMTTQDTSPITEADIAHLPDPVQRYLRWSNVIGKRPVNAVRLKQEGFMYMKPDSSGMPATCEQYYTVNPPAFLWFARVGNFPWFSGRDAYLDGEGAMLIKLFSLFPVVNDQGEGIDQGAMTRFLGEIIWFPTAWLADYLIWEAVDDHHAKVTMTYGGQSATATLTFDDEGRPTLFSVQRCRNEGNSEYTLQTWEAPLKGYGTFEGFNIASEADAVWRLEEGDHRYFSLTIVDANYDCPEPY